MNLNRRQWIARAPVVAGLSWTWLGCRAPDDAPAAGPQPLPQLVDLEARVGGRLGVAFLARGALVGHRLDERFAMTSTFKLPLAAMVLRAIDQGRLALDQFVPYTEADLVSYAPVTETHLGQGGMTVGALAEAAQVHSDNVAANLLLQLIDGPAGLTAMLRSIGDEVTRLDRMEPELNFVPAGEERDTTTPRAMAVSVARLAGDNFLTLRHRQLLWSWLTSTRTGLNRLRAGFPADWTSGDKTGTGYARGMTNKTNDVAVADSPSLGRLVVAAYYDSDQYYDEIREADVAVLAEVGRIATAWFEQAEG